MNNNYSANLRFIKHFRLSNPESKAIDKKKVMNICKTCERTESEGQPFTKGLLDCHDGDCPSCDFERWLESYEGGKGKVKEQWKECRKCGNDFKVNPKYKYHIYCWSCWKR